MLGISGIRSIILVKMINAYILVLGVLKIFSRKTAFSSLRNLLLSILMILMIRWTGTTCFSRENVLSCLSVYLVLVLRRLLRQRENRIDNMPSVS